MPVSQRLEFGRRRDNIIYPVVFHVHGVHRHVRPAGRAEEIVCDPIADLWVRIAAISCQDSMLMVGG
jgi:hypothetical protein